VRREEKERTDGEEEEEEGLRVKEKKLERRDCVQSNGLTVLIRGNRMNRSGSF